MGETFTTEIQARYRDINLAGHVDNVEAVRVLDEARYEFLRFARLPGLPEDATGLLHGVDAGVSELVASQTIEYYAEMRFVPYQPFVAALWVSRIGRSSFTVSAELRVESGGGPASGAPGRQFAGRRGRPTLTRDRPRHELPARCGCQAPRRWRTFSGPRARTRVGRRGPRSALTSRW